MATQKLTSKQVKVFIPTKTKYFETRIDAILRAANRGDLPHAASVASYGIAWAIETCRVSGQVAKTVQGLSDAKLATLVARIGNECPTIGDVPRWLNRTITVAA